MKNIKIKQSLAALLFSLVVLFTSACSGTDTVSTSANPTSSKSTSPSYGMPDIISAADVKPESSKPASSYVGSGKASPVSASAVPVYSGSPYVKINNNIPNFSSAELTVKGYEKYGQLDELGRCTAAVASLGKEVMPKVGETRGSISHIKPTGWMQAKYDNISGKYLYNRCHLIGWQLSAENANRQNLITGTKYLNVTGMLSFENMVADYIKETSNHVAYRVTPIFKGNNLLASGVQIEAYSVEDSGYGICFNVYCFNIQPDIIIDYSSGSSRIRASEPAASSAAAPEVSSAAAPSYEESDQGDTVYITPTGKRYHLSPTCGGKNSYLVTYDIAVSRGLTPCLKCAS